MKLDLTLNSQVILYQNGDYEKIIVDVLQVADKTLICDRDHNVKVFIGSVKVHELRHKCFYQSSPDSSAMDYYAMSKVFSRASDKVYFISNENRGKVVQVDLGAEGYPETYITFPQIDLFQVVFNSHNLLVGIGEVSGVLAFYDVNRRLIEKTLDLSRGTCGSPDYTYRSLDSNRGITIVNGIKNDVTETENVQTLIDRDFQILSTNKITFEGGNLGKYIHKMKIVFLEETGLPVIGMISHHHEDPNFYIYGIDTNKEFTLIWMMQHIHQSSLF